MTGRMMHRGAYAVLGLGRSGIAVCRFLAERLREGVVERVAAYDSKDTPELRAIAEELRRLGIECTLGADSIEDGFSVVVASPGIPPASPLMHSVRKLGPLVMSEIELAYLVSSSPWVAVTGTNGKTTTTVLVGHLLDASGVPAEVVGNIGRPAISVAAETGPATVLVAEVSSFQLMLTESFHPRVAVLLNITPDHIDYHGSFEAYAADKARIFRRQGAGDVAVVDVDDAGSAPYAEAVSSQGVSVVRVSRERVQPGGAYMRDGVLVVESARGPVDLVCADELLIRGAHNVSNALAAAAAALAAGATVDGVREGLRTFRPLEHRLEPVAVVDGVEYFNDSKATNPDSVLKALTAFDDRPVIVLLGGRNKGSSFDGLAAAVAARAKAAIVFGEAKDEIAAAFEGLSGCHVVAAEGLSDAVERAASVARPGDAVVLSPGCASFDEFTSYEHRGAVFKELVQARAGGV